MIPELETARSVVLCVTARESAADCLRAAVEGHPGATRLAFARTGAEALERTRHITAAGEHLAACIADCSLADTEGKVLLRELQRLAPRSATALIAEPDEFDEALQAIKGERTDRVIALNSACDSNWQGHVSALLAHAERLERLRARLTRFEGRHLFVTGATGFLGTRFLRDALRCADLRVTALTRGRKGIAYDRRLPFAECDFSGRLRFVEGDVREAHLGISRDRRASLQESVDEVWHLAALTTFDEVMRDATFAVNLAGTVNTLEFARGMAHLECFNHVSTAYVCGSDAYSGPVYERIGPRPSQFHNPYEESKYLAELEVAQSGLPHLIYRPSIILGESVSGRCDGQTVYNIAKMVRLAKLLGEKDCIARGLPLDYHSFRVVADTQSRKNLIGVDGVIAAMLAIRASTPKTESIFHITHPHPVYIGEIVETIARLLDAERYEIVDSLEGEKLSVPEKALERVARIFRPYMTASDPVFDTSGTRKAIGSFDPEPISKSELAFSMDSFYTQYFGTRYKAVAIGA